MEEKIISNGISDYWYDSCYATKVNIFQTFYSSFQILFHFDSLNWVAIELLILVPIFFRLYGFGIQQKLTKFYNKTRLQLIYFLFYFSFVTLLCSILHIIFPREPACLTWNGKDIEPLRYDYESPSAIVMFSVILFLMFVSADFTEWLGATIIAGFFFLGTALSAILSGAQSISQVIISMAFGAWVFYLFNFLPPVCIPIFIVLIIVIGLSLLIPVLRLTDANRYAVADAATGIRAALLLIITLALYIQFALTSGSFNWFEVKWRGVTMLESNEDSMAVIPGILRVTEDQFGKRLNRDIIYSLVAFVLVLIASILCTLLINDYFLFNSA